MDPLDDKVRLKAIEASMEGLKSPDWQARNDAILCLSAFGDGLGEGLGVAEARMIDDDNLAHDLLQSFDLS